MAQETNHDHVKLTSSELAALWGSFMNNTLGNCMISYFLKDVEDPDIRPLLEYYLELSKQHIGMLKDLFTKENIPVPTGFTDEDINLNAKRLYPDTFMLYYIQSIGSMGINTYSLALPTSSRTDIRELYTSFLVSSSELFNRASNVLLEKGLFIRPPHIPYPSQREFVHKQNFLAGWLGDQRPLTAMEISFLFFNLYRNTLERALLTGFSQVAQSQEVRRYMERVIEVSKHHSDVFSKFLMEDNLVSPMTWDILPLTSEEVPFSDKLMMFHTAVLNTAGIGYYGTSISTAVRKDLSASYARLTMEAAELSADGAKIMIENGWFEKPFSAPERDS